MRINSGGQRQVLRTAVLRVRSERATSRSALARELNLSPSTAGVYVDGLIAAGYLDESGLEQGSMGRPKRHLSLRADAGWFAGVELNAERIQAVRVDFSGRETARREEPLPRRPDVAAALTGIKRALAALEDEAGGRGRLLSIGVGAPGVVDPETGVCLHYSLIDHWDRVPLADRLGDRFAVPVIVENNLRVIALAERWFGGGKDLDDFIVLGPRSGFGVAMMQGGKLTRGASHAAGEIGRWPWPLQGLAGERELQEVLSAPAVFRRLAGMNERDKLPPDLRAALAKSAKTSGRAWRGVIDDYARVVGLLQSLIDPQVLFLHGPLTELGTPFCEAIVDRVPDIFPALKEGGPRLAPSELGDEAGALGAASLAMESWLPENLPAGERTKKMVRKHS